MLTRSMAFALLLACTVPSATAAPLGTFVDRVVAAESGGNPQARPRDPVTGERLSSAFGAGQFVDATWLAMVRKYRPDLAAASDDKILDMRSDAALSREMVVRYAQENRTYLINEDLKPTAAALYLAHFAGPRGTAKLLKSHRDTPVEDILSRKAVEANGFLEGKTVAMLYAWAKAKMKVDAVPASSPLTLASRKDIKKQKSTGNTAQQSAEPSTREVRLIRRGVVEVVRTSG